MELKQAEIIQVLRRRAQMNQGDFGAKAFSTSFESGRTKVKNIELGKQVPTDDDLKNMAEVLGLPVSELMPSTDAQPTAGIHGVEISRPVLDRFPGLEDYLGMLEKAVKIDDSDLIGYITDKISSLLHQPQDAEYTRRRSG
ncbi:hypothetical protein D3OALGB2SA_1536 [Olavius algarvensis associated proteobacterium Delta 3]|nr:hypothetical protein D3OALGB2SA_1536 [Olavius algarvensis associated proteobacterium Delta 3]